MVPLVGLCNCDDITACASRPTTVLLHIMYEGSLKSLKGINADLMSCDFSRSQDN